MLVISICTFDFGQNQYIMLTCNFYKNSGNLNCQNVCCKLCSHHIIHPVWPPGTLECHNLNWQVSFKDVSFSCRSNGPSHKASTSFTARPTPSPRQRPLSPRVSCCPLNKAELDLYIVESDPPQSLSSNALTGSSPKMEKESKAKPRKRSLSLRGPKAEGHSPLSVKKRGLHGVSHSPTVTQEDIGSPWKRRIMPPGLGNHRDADISPFSPSLGPESLSGRYHIPTQTEGKESLKKKWRSPQAESCQWDHLDTSPANRNTPQAPGYHHNHADANPGKRNLSQVMDSYKDADVVITESYHIPESARKKNLKFCSPTTKQKERRENLRLAGAKLQCLIERVRLSPTTTPKRKLNHKS